MHDTFRKTPRSGRSRRPLGIAFATLTGGAAVLAVIPAAASAASWEHPHTTSPLTVALTKTKYGSILTEDGFALYRYTLDQKNKSDCVGTCATTFPPLLLPKGQSKPVGKDVTDLGVITRSNGGLQVTYEGLPLYRYKGDSKAGQTSGDALSKKWYVINPASPTTVPKATSSSGSSTAVNTGGISY